MTSVESNEEIIIMKEPEEEPEEEMKESVGPPSPPAILPTPTTYKRLNCIVGGCKPNPHSKFHRFPLDPILQMIWIKRCRRKGEINVQHARVCDSHFLAQDYIVDSSGAKSLKVGAVPLVNSPSNNKQSFNNKIKSSSSSTPTTILSTSSISRKSPSFTPIQERKAIIAQLLKESSLEKSSPVTIPSKPPPPPPPSSSTTTTTCTIDQPCSKRIKGQIATLKKHLNKSRGETVELRKKIRQLTSKKAKSQILRSTLSQSQTSSQVKRILHPRRKFQRNYSKEDIIRALILRSISPKAFEFVKSWDIYSLPCRHTQDSFLRNFICTPGILKEGIALVNTHLSSISSKGKHLAVLSFDEMPVRSVWEHKTRTRKIALGPHDKMLLVIAQGISCNWKQPVYVGFDVELTVELLYQIIGELEGYGIRIVSTVFSTANKDLMDALGLNVDNLTFPHPNKKDSIVASPDTAEVLKLLRNTVLDSGLGVLDPESGYYNVLQKSDFLSTLNKTNGKAKAKIKDTHLNPQGKARHKTKIAAQLFSKTMASAMEVAFPAKKAQASIVNKINDWFDVLNSGQNLDNLNDLSTPFGQSYDRQIAALHSMDELAVRFRTTGSPECALLQEIIRMSVHSAITLFALVNTADNNIHIFTNRLNKDNIDVYFAYIRSTNDGTVLTTPYEALRQLRILMIGPGNNVFTSTNYNTVLESASSFSMELNEEDNQNDNQQVSGEVQCIYEEVDTDEEEVIHEEDIIIEDITPA